MSLQHKSPKRDNVILATPTEISEAHVPTSLKIKKISEKLLNGTKLRSDQQEKVARQGKLLHVFLFTRRGYCTKAKGP